MPTFTHGKKTRVLINDKEMSEFFKEYSAAFTMDTAETSSFGSEVKTFVQGMSSGTLSLSGMFDGTAGAVDAQLSGSIGASIETIAVIAPTGSFAVGASLVAGKAWTGSYQVSGSIGDIVGVSAEMTGSGGFRPGVSLHDLTAESASTNSASHTRLASSSNGAIATLNLLTNTRDGNTTVKVQHSSDNVTFVDLVTFTVVSAAATSAQSVIVAPDVTINRYTRASSTLAGTTGSVTYNVALVRL